MSETKGLAVYRVTGHRQATVLVVAPSPYEARWVGHTALGGCGRVGRSLRLQRWRRVGGGQARAAGGRRSCGAALRPFCRNLR